MVEPGGLLGLAFLAGWRTGATAEGRKKRPGHGSGAPGWQKDGANVLHRQTSSWQMTSQVGERDSTLLGSEAIDLEAWLVEAGWIEVGRFSPAPLNGRMDGPRWRVGRGPRLTRKIRWVVQRATALQVCWSGASYSDWIAGC